MSRRCIFLFLLVTLGVKAQAQSDTVTTLSGLKYIITTPGQGAYPIVAQSTVWVHYVGKLKNGLIFDASSLVGKPIKIKLGRNEVIPAWEEILPKMRQGSKLTLFSPARLAYGTQGVEAEIEGEYKVPPNQDLIFEMEMVKIKN